MKKQIFIATVKIAVIAENESEACDSISGCLSENLMQPGPNGEEPAIVDWQYISPDFKTPYSIGEIEYNWKSYEEGTVFTFKPEKLRQ